MDNVVEEARVPVIIAVEAVRTAKQDDDVAVHMSLLTLSAKVFQLLVSNIQALVAHHEHYCGLRGIAEEGT